MVDLEPHDVAAALEGWATGQGPLYRQLADAVATRISRGEIPDGARLPAERPLAEALHVSRTTVIAAYRLLRAGGRLTSRRGSGTFATAPPQPDDRRPRARLARAPHDAPAAIRTLMGVRRDVVDLASATLGASEALTHEVLASGLAELERHVGQSGYDPHGLPALREAIAARLTRTGTPTPPEAVLVTGGGQQALTLLAELLLERGTFAAVEDPTYVGALDIFARRGAHLIGIPVAEGAAPGDALQAAAASRDVRLAYLMPTFHNPTGAVMPHARRRALVRIATEHALPLVEDQALADLALDEAAPPTLASLDAGGTVIQIGSLSKSCWAGLRIGWIRATPETIDRLVRIKTVDDLATSLPSQALAVSVLSDFDRIVELRRAQVRERIDLMLDLLGERLPDWEPVRPRGGASLWVRLPDADADRFAQLALRHGVSVLPGASLSPTRSFSDHVRLQLLQPLEQLDEGVDRLARAWREYQRRERFADRDLRVVV